MARDFSKNTANYASLGAGAIGPILSGAAGVTIACWANPDTLASVDGDDTFLAYHSSASSAGLRLRHSTGAFITSAFRRQNADTVHSRLGATTVTTGSWIHVGTAVTFGAASKIYFNGADDSGSVASGSAATTTAGTYVSSSGSNHDAIGCAMSGSTPISTNRQVDGRLAELAIWNVELTDAEFASLAKGFTPNQIRPQSLVAYWPMVGAETVLRDLVNGKNGTITGSIPDADHPRVYA